MSCYAELPDSELTVLLAARNKDAFTEIYNRYWPVLYQYACRFAARNDVTEDIVQDVFVSLWNRAGSMEAGVSLKAYLYASVRYRILDAIDHEKIKGRYMESLQAFINHGNRITEDHIRERELARQIELGLRELPLRMREVFEMSRKNGLSQKEIALQLNISDKTVKKQINKALRILRLKLDTLLPLLLFFLK